MDSPLILRFVTLTIFSLMPAIGINHSIQQLTFLWRQPASLLRSLLAVAENHRCFIADLWSFRIIGNHKDDVGYEGAIMLKEVLDRIELPPFSEIIV